MSRTIRMLGVLIFVVCPTLACSAESGGDLSLAESPVHQAALTIDSDAQYEAASTESADVARDSIPPGEPCGDGLCSQSGRCQYRKGREPECVPRLPSDIFCGENVVCPDGYECVGGDDTGIQCTPWPMFPTGKTCADKPCGPNTACEDHKNWDGEIAAFCRPTKSQSLRCEYVRCRGGYVCVERANGTGVMCVPPPPVSNEPLPPPAP